MSKIISVVFLCLLSFNIQAQLNWGVQVGTTISDLTVGRGTDIRSGALVGMTGSYCFKNKLVLQSAVQFITKGVNGVEYIDQSRKMQTGLYMNFNLFYLELPVMVGYKMPLMEHINLVPAVGVFAALGVGGTGSVRGYLFSNEWNPFENIQWDNDMKTEITGFNRFDGGLRFAMGAEVYKFDFSLSYDLGLCGVQDNIHFDPLKTPMTRSLSIVLGYKF